jgi:hypothetical protein
MAAKRYIQMHNLRARQFNSSRDIAGYWYWADGVPLNENSSYPRYFEWTPGEPNDGASTLWASLWIGGTAIADNACWAKFPALCEVHGEICPNENRIFILRFHLSFRFAVQ